MSRTLLYRSTLCRDLTAHLFFVFQLVALSQFSRGDGCIIHQLINQSSSIEHEQESCAHQKKWTAGQCRNRLGCDYTLSRKEGDGVLNVNNALYNGKTIEVMNMHTAVSSTK